MPIKVYAFRNKLSVTNKSSSGGAFSAIIETVTEMYSKETKVVVYGALFDDINNVIHKAAYSLKECEQFRGSKYVKSSIKKEIYQNICKELSDGYAVIFSGTPCQVYALKSYLKRKNINTNTLLLIDLICHGTPNKDIWNDYLKWIENKYNSKVAKISFRDKSIKGKKYCMRIALKNGKVLINRLDTLIYLRLFLEGMILSKGCLRCPFAKLEREGDITLGDFWGVEQVMCDFPSDNGVSEILVNTTKGMNIIDKIIEKSKTGNGSEIQECISNEYIEYQNNLKRPAAKPKNYDEFWSDYYSRGFDFVIKKYLNYGSIQKIKYYLKNHMFERR